MKNGLKPYPSAIHTLHVSNGALQAKELPTRLKVMSWGENLSTKGPFHVTEATATGLPGFQKSLGFDRVAIDFNHNSLPGSPTYQPDPRHVAGYGTPALVAGEGMFLENITWTPKGEEFARDYHDLSPAVAKDEAHAVTFLHSVALTPHGAVEGLTFYSAFGPAGASQPNTMDYKKALCAALGLPETADDTAIQAKIQALAATKKPEESTKDPKPEDLSVRTPDAGAIAALSAQVQTLAGEMKAMRTEGDKAARTRLLEQAAQLGKVVPLSADNIALLPIAALSELIEKLPAGVVPTAANTPGNVSAHSTSGTAMSNTEREVMKHLNISEDVWKKAA